MAYIKYKEVTKYFNFSKYIDSKLLPKYTLDYVFEDEKVLVSYRTSRDYGLFTNKKMILFDNTNLFNLKKHVTIVPYKSISTCTVIFKPVGAEMSLFLDSGYPLVLKFVNMSAEDKVRLRLLFSAISKYVNNQKESKEEIERLINNDVSFK